MERYLQRVSKEFVSVPKPMKTKNNKILKRVLEILTQKMKKNARFDQLYKRIFYGGSYYDGLKVGTPDEYDIDLLLQFPSTHPVQITISELPSFVNLYLKNKTGFEDFFQVDENGNLCLDTKKVLSWMESVIQKAFDEFATTGSWYILGGQHYLVQQVNLSMRYHKTNGPAFTLIIKGKNGGEDMEVDLVPCFLFSNDKWPPGFKSYTTTNKKLPSEFFVVPKHPKNVTSNRSKYWRLSFQIQERDMILSKGFLKPALKLLKKLRDVQEQSKMYSYFLKTVVLWEVKKNNDVSFWTRNSFSYIFMHILKAYQECLEHETIQYYWTHKKCNLLETSHVDWSNMNNRMKYIINDIERNIKENPDRILEHILTSEEKDELVVLPKKRVGL